MTIATWLSIGGTLVLVACAVEAAARWWIAHRRQYFVLPPGLRLRLAPDPGVFPHLERTVRFDVNALGERGDELPSSTEGVYRVLVAGGSQPEGYLLDQDTAWPGGLQRLLEQRERLDSLGAERVHVGNIARSGVGSEALDLILRRVLPRYPRLQAIIILVGASDVLQWLERGAPAAAPPPPRTADVFRCHPELTFGWRPGQLAFTELLLRARQRWLRPAQVHPRACRWIARAREMRSRATDVRTEMPDPSSMLSHFDRHLRSAIRQARAHAERVVVVRQPWFDKPCTPAEEALMWHGGVGQAWREQVTTYYSSDVLSRLMALLDARAVRAATELGVEQVDLMTVLERSERTYYDFFHATPAGARVIASTIAAALLLRPRCDSATSASALSAIATVDCCGEEFAEKAS